MQIATKYGVDTDKIRFWVMVNRQNKTIRPDTLVPENDLTLNIYELANFFKALEMIRDKMLPRRGDLLLYMESCPVTSEGGLLEAWDSLDGTGSSTRILIFLKYFDIEKQTLQGISRIYINRHDKISVLISIICSLMNWPLTTSIQLYEEIKPSMIEVMKLKQTFYQAEIQDGDIICFQKVISEEEMEKITSNGGYGSAVEYYDFLLNKINVSFKPRFVDQSITEEFDLILSRKTTYDMLSFKVAEYLNVQPTHIRFTTINSTTQMPKFTIIMEEYQEFSDPSIIYTFYQRLFPFKYLFKWLNRSSVPSKAFSHREIAFTLQNDAYLRYLSFPTYEAFRKEVLRLNPLRFEIGPIYNVNPRDRKTLRKSMFKPLEKELVFDIDLTDYDDIRTCCSKTTICLKCWNWMTVAIKVIDLALKEDFGFQYILWVYSGRRGVHAWVCDKKARELNDQKRKAVITYLQLEKSNIGSNRKIVLKRPLHPSISRSLQILRDTFRSSVLISQNPWESDEGSEKLLEFISDHDLKEALRKKWKSQENRSSYNKWQDVDHVAESGVSKNLDTKELLAAKQDIILEYMYPRLDIE
ncbi:hypothetical protein PCK2_000132, partial [Pneumocystis canis]